MNERVFEAFVQSDSTTTRQYGGTGLGLPISRRLARMLGGELTASSEVGGGSAFVLELPTGDIGGQLARERDIFTGSVSSGSAPSAGFLELIGQRIEVGAHASDVELVVDLLNQLMMCERLAEEVAHAELHACRARLDVIAAG